MTTRRDFMAGAIAFMGAPSWLPLGSRGGQPLGVAIYSLLVPGHPSLDISVHDDGSIVGASFGSKLLSFRKEWPGFWHISSDEVDMKVRIVTSDIVETVMEIVYVSIVTRRDSHAPQGQKTQG